MRDTLIKTLQEFWLTTKDAQVYMTTLELWQAPTSMIARYCGYKRVSTYVILEDLVRKGMMRCVTKNKIKTYSVVELNQIVNQEKTRIQHLETLLPDFTNIADSLRGKPKTQVFEWLEAMKEAYKDLLSNGQVIYSFLGAHAADQKIVDWLNKEFLPQRLKKQIVANVLVCKTEGNKKKYDPHTHNKSNKQKVLTNIKTLKEKQFSLNSEVNIYGNDKLAIMLFTAKEMSAIMIQSKQLYETMKAIFDFMWSLSDEIE